jgi:hypothetical protein
MRVSNPSSLSIIFGITNKEVFSQSVIQGRCVCQNIHTQIYQHRGKINVHVLCYPRAQPGHEASSIY